MELRVAVIIGSTREGRAGERIGRWFAGVAGERGELEVDVVDLAGFELPQRYPHEATAEMSRFAERIGEADAFVVVTPEYNRSFPASLKQAIDCAYDEWRAKPVGFVSYGYRSEGLYAVEQLRSVFTELHTVTLRDGVGFSLAETGFGERHCQAARALLDELIWWGLALRDARIARPYVS